MDEYLTNIDAGIEFMMKIYTEEILMVDEDGDDWTEEYQVFVIRNLIHRDSCLLKKLYYKKVRAPKLI